MKIIVVGCGKIGTTIISSLVHEKHDVVAIDSDPSIVEEIANAYDVISLCGNGTEYTMLKDAGVDKTELFVAVTGSDELNMLACFAAKRMGAKHTVARIRDLENNDESLIFMQKQLELSLAINPERMAAEAMYNILKLPSASKVETFNRNKLEMIEIILDEDNSALNGLSLIELRKKCNERFLVCTVERDEEMYIPNGTFTLKNGDKLGIMATKRSASKILSDMGLNNAPVKSVIILGAGTISNYLAKILIAGKHSVKLIDHDKQVCEEVCERLPSSATVIYGNGMSQELLIEEGINDTDAFVALTGRDEDNILISFYAISKEVGKVITKVNNEELLAIADNLGLDTIISPRKIVANLIVKYARALENSMDSQIETLYSLSNGKAEALEFNVLDDFKFTGIPLKEMKINKNVLIAGITRGSEGIIPSGNDVILPGDSVIIIAEGKRVLSLADIIER